MRWAQCSRQRSRWTTSPRWAGWSRFLQRLQKCSSSVCCSTPDVPLYTETGRGVLMSSWVHLQDKVKENSAHDRCDERAWKQEVLPVSKQENASKARAHLCRLKGKNWSTVRRDLNVHLIKAINEGFWLGSLETNNQLLVGNPFIGRCSYLSCRKQCVRIV